MNKTVVAKFGGTSLASAEQFRKVKAIIEADPARRIIVASAPGKRYDSDTKVTDLLLSCYDRAIRRRDFEPMLKRVEERFREIITDLELEFPLDQEIEEIRRHLKELPQRAYMASRGEYLNSQILAQYLGFTFVDPAWCVCFRDDDSLDEEMTRRAMKAALRPLKKAVIAGFYGADGNEVIHTFSRGGSDISGSLAAWAIGAELYENWTDVSGLLTADPRIVQDPAPVDYISYKELRTLSYMGASVMHTDAVLPASLAEIPINIRNTNRPEDPGTMIVSRVPSDKKASLVTGVAGRTGMAVIQAEKVMVSDGAGFCAVLLDILKKRNIPFEMCLTGIDTVTITLRSGLLASCKKEVENEINERLNPDRLAIREGLALIAVVGESENHSGDVFARVFQSLHASGIEVRVINLGAGVMNLLIGVSEDRYKDAIRAIYEGTR